MAETPYSRESMNNKPVSSSIWRHYPVFPALTNNHLAQAVSFVIENYEQGIIKYRYLGSLQEIPEEQVKKWIMSSREKTSKLIRITY